MKDERGKRKEERGRRTESKGGRKVKEEGTMYTPILVLDVDALKLKRTV